MLRLCKCLRDCKVVGLDDVNTIDTTSPVFREKVVPTTTYLALFETIDARSVFELPSW